MATSTPPTKSVCLVNRLVPFVHVVDVEASLAFYELLGFLPRHAMKDAQGRTFWALAQSGGAEIMLTRADGPIDAGQQAIILYMYSTDVAALRDRLLAGGVRDGNVYSGAAKPGDGFRMVFEVAHPHYMLAGEVRVIDPDGYVILIGQLE